MNYSHQSPKEAMDGCGFSMPWPRKPVGKGGAGAKTGKAASKPSGKSRGGGKGRSGGRSKKGS